MDSKSIPRNSLTLLLAFVLGSGVAAISRSRETAPSHGDSSAARSTPARQSASASAATNPMARSSPEAIACASAWESLKDGRLKREQRIKAQLALLEEWTRHDPSAALVAFSSEFRGGTGRPFTLEEFDPRPVMVANPDVVEDLLKSGRLGLCSQLFRAMWFHHLAEADPLGTFDRLGELPAGSVDRVLESVAQGLPSISEDPVTWQQGMERISALISRPVKGSKTQAIAEGLGNGTSLADLNAAYLATDDRDLRDLFVRAARESARGDDPFADETETPAEFHSLPEPFRSAVIGKWKAETDGKIETLPSPPE